LLAPGIGAGQVVPAATLFACAVIFVVLLRGATGVSPVSNFLFAARVRRAVDAVPARIAPLAGTHRRAPAWRPGPPVELHHRRRNRHLLHLSWWPYIGAMIRMAPNGRTVAVPVMLGMGAPVPLLSLIGSPACWCSRPRIRRMAAHRRRPHLCGHRADLRRGREFRHGHRRHLCLGVGLRNFQARCSAPWTMLLLLTIMPVALRRHDDPGAVLLRFGNFLALIGVGFAPLCGIQIADYFVLRRRRLDIRAIYDAGTRAPTRSGRIQSRRAAALAAGCASTCCCSTR
jgi:nucleobase:cation symporter-1, NCS1 family